MRLINGGEDLPTIRTTEYRVRRRRRPLLVQGTRLSAHQGQPPQLTRQVSVTNLDRDVTAEEEEPQNLFVQDHSGARRPNVMLVSADSRAERVCTRRYYNSPHASQS